MEHNFHLIRSSVGLKPFAESVEWYVKKARQGSEDLGGDALRNLTTHPPPTLHSESIGLSKLPEGKF